MTNVEWLFKDHSECLVDGVRYRMVPEYQKKRCSNCGGNVYPLIVTKCRHGCAASHSVENIPTASPEPDEETP